jgi:hypothetical protein
MGHDIIGIYQEHIHTSTMTRKSKTRASGYLCALIAYDCVPPPPPLKKRGGGGGGGKNLAINKNSGELLTMEEPDFYEITASSDISLTCDLHHFFLLFIVCQLLPTQ